MSKDSTYYAYLADEVTVQRNGAMDELALARTEVRLANIQIASLETELFHVKEDLAAYADTVDYLAEYAESIGGYVEHLEQNADAALAESQRRLRERIDVLEAENKRLEALVDWNYVDHLERTGRNIVNPDMEPWYGDDGGEVLLNEFADLPPPPFKIEAGGAPGQTSEVTGEPIFGGNWVEVKDQPSPEDPAILIPTIIIPTAEEIAAANTPTQGIAGAPGQGAQVIGTVGTNLTNPNVVDAIVAKNSGDVLPVTSTPVDDLEEVVLPETGDTSADAKIRKRIEELKAEKEGGETT